MAFAGMRTSSVGSGSVGRIHSHTNHHRPKMDSTNSPKAKFQGRRNAFRRLSAFIPRLLGQQEILEDVEESSTTSRYRPETLQQLCKTTKFSKKELQLMYRGFKEVYCKTYCCPTGQVSLEQFKEIYAHFFPQGDSSQYAIFIFNTFDNDKNGSISFDEFVTGLSVLSRGSENEKLRWIFDLYDIDHDGCLTRDDLEVVINSIYDMMGPNTDPPTGKDTVKKHVDDVFSKMDKDSNGSITWTEFLEACQHDFGVSQSLRLFDTMFSPLQSQ